MRTKLVRLLIMLGLAFGLVASPAPAHAASDVTLEFTGSVTVSPGLTITGPRNAVFSFTYIACTDVVVGTKKQPGTGSCAVTASGTLTGVCGSVTGSGTARIITHDGHQYQAHFVFVSAAGNVEIVTDTVVKLSTGQRGAGAGYAHAVPTASTGGALACVNNAGATRYDVILGTLNFAVI